MAQAWVVRASQRQRFSERIFQASYRRHGEESKKDPSLTYDEWCMTLAATLLECMRQWASLGRLWKPFEGGEMSQTRAGAFLKMEVLPRIVLFAHTPAELAFILTRLFRKAAESACVPFHQALVIQEMEDPAAVFHAPSATAEIEFPNDEE